MKFDTVSTTRRLLPRFASSRSTRPVGSPLAETTRCGDSFPLEPRKFFVLPFARSEDLADQERSVALARRLGANDLAHAEQHRDIVRCFGRFPHRNQILDRPSTREETEYLANGGYAG
jgi:uncharacterized protein (DUF924 family)